MFAFYVLNSKEFTEKKFQKIGILTKIITEKSDSRK